MRNHPIAPIPSLVPLTHPKLHNLRLVTFANTARSKEDGANLDQASTEDSGKTTNYELNQWENSKETWSKLYFRTT